jgi:hypothetical protein
MKDPISILPALQINLTRDLVWPVFFLACLAASVFGAILFFHWRMYGMKNRLIFIAEAVFILVTILIVIFSFYSALGFVNYA